MATRRERLQTLADEYDKAAGYAGDNEEKQAAADVYDIVASYLQAALSELETLTSER